MISVVTYLNVGRVSRTFAHCQTQSSQSALNDHGDTSWHSTDGGQKWQGCVDPDIPDHDTSEVL